MCANSEGSGETAQMGRLAWGLAGCLCDKYHNLMGWLKYAYIKFKLIVEGILCKRKNLLRIVGCKLKILSLRILLFDAKQLTL